MATFKRTWQDDGDKVAEGGLPLFRLIYKNDKILTITDPIVIEKDAIRAEIISVLEFHITRLKAIQ